MSDSDHQEIQRSTGPQCLRLLFDFDKSAKDLFFSNYDRHFKVSIRSDTDIGLTLTSNVVKYAGASRGGIEAKYSKYTDDATVNINFYSNKQISGLLTVNSTILPSMESTLVLRNYQYVNTQMILIQPRVQYFHKYAALAMSVPWLRSLHLDQSVPNFISHPELQLSATVGTPKLAFGMNTTYDTYARQFYEFEAGISMTMSNCEASIVLKNKGEMLKATYLHYFDHERKFSAAATITRRFSLKENILTVGGSWAVDNRMIIKARFDNLRHLATVLQHEITPKANLTISTEFDVRDCCKRPAIGLALSLVL